MPLRLRMQVISLPCVSSPRLVTLASYTRSVRDGPFSSSNDFTFPMGHKREYGVTGEVAALRGRDSGESKHLIVLIVPRLSKTVGWRRAGFDACLLRLIPNLIRNIRLHIRTKGSARGTMPVLVISDLGLWRTDGNNPAERHPVV